jgi:hypothetical protein
MLHFKSLRKATSPPSARLRRLQPVPEPGRDHMEPQTGLTSK